MYFLAHYCKKVLVQACATQLPGPLRPLKSSGSKLRIFWFHWCFPLMFIIYYDYIEWWFWALLLWFLSSESCFKFDGRLRNPKQLMMPKEASRSFQLADWSTTGYNCHQLPLPTQYIFGKKMYGCHLKIKRIQSHLSSFAVIQIKLVLNSRSQSRQTAASAPVGPVLPC